MTNRLAKACISAAALLGVVGATAACDPFNATATVTSGGSASAGVSGGSGAGAGGSSGTGTSSGSGSGSGSGATGAAGTGLSVTATPGGASLPECSAAQLRVTVKDGGAGMSHDGILLVFTNVGLADCFMQGYPGAALTIGGGKTLNAQRTMSGYLGGDEKDAKPPYVTVAAGASVSALLEWSNMQIGDGTTLNSADCPGYAPSALTVTPPDTKVSTSLSAPQAVCRDFVIHPVIPVVANSTNT